MHHDYIVSLEDGKRYQTLKRHLTALGMTPDEYRAKWGLNPNYLMTSTAYSEKRSEMSKVLGLGRKKAVEPVRPQTATKKPRAKASAKVEAAEPTLEPKRTQDAPEAVQEAT